jgi:hypothetical protein
VIEGQANPPFEPNLIVPEPSDKRIVHVNILPRKSAKLNPYMVPVPQTDTRSRERYTKALE